MAVAVAPTVCANVGECAAVVARAVVVRRHPPRNRSSLATEGAFEGAFDPVQSSGGCRRIWCRNCRIEIR